MAEWRYELQTNIGEVLNQIKTLQNRVNELENEKHQINLDIDSKKLEKVITNLDKMLESLGKGSGDFKEFENLSKQLTDIIKEAQTLNKSLGGVNDKGVSNLLSSISDIESIIKKLSEESNNAPKIDLFNEEQLQQILPIFSNIETCLSSLKKTISDVGDGEEFSPLLKMINNVQSEITNLSKSVSDIKLNVNMDLGSEVSERLNQKVAQSTSRQLEAYRKLFSAMKSTGKTNKEMFSFYEPEDANTSDLIGLYKEMISRAEKQFATTVKVNGRTVKSNAYKDRLGDEYLAYKKEIENATRQLSRAETKRSDSGILNQLFGGGDLTEVISYLDKIAVKLEEISSAASKFNETFQKGFNVTASVEEIEKLTNRVRELENELSKIKSTPVDSNVNKSNISSENSIVESQNKIQEELKETQKQAEETAKGIITVYRGLKSSSDEIFDTTHSSAWFSDNIESANSYTRGIGDVYKSQIKIDNPMIVDANGANHERILYAETNEELQEAIKLQDELNSKRKEFTDKYGKYLETQDMSLLDNPSEYLKASDALDELEVKLSKYLKTTEQLQEIAKNGGYDGLIIRNVKDNFMTSDQNVGTSYAIFDKEKLIAYERIDYLKELEKQVNSTSEAEKNLSNTPIKDVFQGDNKVTTDASTTAIKEESQALEQVSTSAKEAATSKEKFANANKEVKVSADASTPSVEEESDALDKVSKRSRSDADNIKLEQRARIYKELNSSLDRYAIVAGRVANGKTLSTDEEEMARLQVRIEELQNEPILSETQLELSRTKLEKIETSLENIQEKLQLKRIDSIQTSIDSYNKDYKGRVNGRPVEENRGKEYQQLLNKYKASIDALQAKKDELAKQPTISEDDLNSVRQMTDAVEENKKALMAMSAAEKGSTEGSRRKEIDKITKYLKDNTRISEEAKTKLKEYLDLLRNGGADVNVDKIHNGFLKVTEAERLAGNEGKRFIDVIKDKAWYGWAAQIASYFSLQDIIRYFIEGATVVKEFDDGLTNISYTMDVTKSQLDGIGQSVLGLSKDLKSSIDDSMQVAKIYANMNTTAEEIKKLSEPTLIMTNLTGFDASTMADDIQAVTQQFEIAAEDSMHIADVYDTISRNISVDYSKILELTLETM